MFGNIQRQVHTWQYRIGNGGAVFGVVVVVAAVVSAAVVIVSAAVRC